MKNQPKNGQTKATIIIPTYNEAQNIGVLLTALEKIFTQIPEYQISIVVVDDNSPDQTAAVVKTHQQKNRAIHLLSGEKNGLGEAYKRGFNFAISELDPEYIFQMDSDFQHDPKDIPRFLEQTQKGYEFVIGSRYIPGGDCPEWEFKRKIYSWLANRAAQLIVGIKNISDCTSGYRCISRKFLESINIKKLKSSSYAFQLSLLDAATKKNLKIKEIPILFGARRSGTSKLGRKEIWDFILNAFRLRFRRYTK